jgi:hypothetical protein
VRANRNRRIRGTRGGQRSPGTQPTFYHSWYLAPRGTGCLVVTDEVGNGPDAANLRHAGEGLMHRGHDLWLATLRWVAENKPN